MYLYHIVSVEICFLLPHCHQSGCSYTEDEFNTDLEYIDLDLFDVRQSFEKFLVDKDGHVQFRYHASLSAASDLMPDIDALISA